MFIAHLPAGYLLYRSHPALQNARFWVLTGAILPDADLAVFYLIQNGAVHHHTYLSHRPVMWLAILLSGIMLRRCKHPTARSITALGAGGLLHMLLDSVAGAIVWGWPISHQAHPWIIVPATQDWWVMSFVLHWSFGIEVVICTVAAIVWRRPARHQSHVTP